MPCNAANRPRDRDALLDRLRRGWGLMPCRTPFRGFVAQMGIGDSSRESSLVARMHEQTYTPDLQDQELDSL